MIFLLFFIFSFISVDLFFLKKWDFSYWRSTFRYPLFLIVFIVGILGIFIAGTQDPLKIFLIFVFLYFFPSYLLRRDRFLHKLRDQQLSHKLILMADMLGVLLYWIFGSCIFLIILKSLHSVDPSWISGLGELILSAIFSSALIFILIWRASRQFSLEGFLTNIGLRMHGGSVFKIIVLPIIIGTVLAGVSSYLLTDRSIQPDTPLSEILSFSSSSFFLLAFLGIALFIAPLLEEIIFRGYFFHVLKHIIGLRATIYIIAGLFASLHVHQYWGDWLAIGMVTLLGLILTLLRAWSYSIIPSVATHYTYNIAVTILPVLFLAALHPTYFQYQKDYLTLDTATKERLLKQSITQHPDFMQAYHELSLLYTEEKIHLEAALELINDALKVQPQSIGYLDTKAEVLTQLGRFNKAQEIREDIIARTYSSQMKQYQEEKIQELP